MSLAVTQHKGTRAPAPNLSQLRRGSRSGQQLLVPPRRGLSLPQRAGSRVRPVGDRPRTEGTGCSPGPRVRMRLRVGARH